MRIKPRPTVGFDRFVRCEWMDAALDLALAEEGPQTLRSWLAEQISGQEAVRKTLNLLTNLWFGAYAETQDLRRQALTLARHLPRNTWMMLHWGMALANFPFFRAVAQIIGRLGRLQSAFTRQEIHIRLQERYSNQRTIQRAADWMIQSLVSWGLLVTEETHLSLTPPWSVPDTAIATWLVKAVLLDWPGRRAYWQSLLQAPELFPWTLPEGLRASLHHLPEFQFARTASGEEEVLWQEPST